MKILGIGSVVRDNYFGNYLRVTGITKQAIFLSDGTRTILSATLPEMERFLASKELEVVRV